MKIKISRIIRTMFVFMFVICLGPVVLKAEVPDTIQLDKGQQKTIKAESLTRVAIANSEIADVQVLSEGNELLIMALSEGITDVTLWDSAGQQKVIRIVVGKNIQDLANDIKGLLSEIEGVQIRVVGDKIVLDGAVLTVEDMTRIDKIGKAYEGKVLSLITLSRGTQSQVLESAVTKAINMPNVQVKVVGDKIILEGTVFNQSDVDRAGKVAGMYAGEVVNLLKAGSTMVEIDVHFAQVDMSKGKDIGSNILKSLSLSGDFGLTGGSALANTTTYGIAANALANLNALVSNGSGQIISQPHLSTVSGKTASFHSGGEIGYEVSGVGAADIKWKQYGLILNIEPTVASDGSVTNHINIEVSAPVTSGTTSEKAFTMFKTESDMVCKQGETIVISGLVQSIKNKFREKTPVLGDIPILNLFFSHKTEDQSNKELVVLVTPTVTTVTQSEAAPASSGYQEVLKKSEQEEEKK